MLYLPSPSPIDLTEFYNSIKADIENALSVSQISNEVKTFLSAHKIKEIITDTPEKLLTHHHDLMSKLVPTHAVQRYEEYFKVKRKSVRKRSVYDQLLFTEYTDAINKINEIFNYEKFISQSKKTSYALADKLNRNTCTYCNRLYTNTVITKNIKSKLKSNKVTRPQFDHWYAKSIYPVLALSFYNLIPSCNICNSSVKGNTNFLLSTHIHPYIFEINQNFTFSFYFSTVHNNNIKINAEEGSKIDNTLKAFKIKEIYDAHSNLELKDLLDLKYKYSENYLNLLFNNLFSQLEVSEKEAYRLVFGIEFEENNFHKRSFSKFKSDILDELMKID